MKKSILLLSFVLMFLASCQTEEISLIPFDDGRNELIDDLIPARQITDDVNSKEVDNILDKLFKGKSKSRAGYTISILKDKQGKDAIICVNFAGNGGFALISAVKTHEPILAYAEEGNFTDVDDLKFPLNDWYLDILEDVSLSVYLPEDSLSGIRARWRNYEESTTKLLSRVDEYGPDKSKLVNIPYEKYIELSRVILELTGKWQAEGDRVFEIDEYNRNLAMGDKFQIAGYVQGSIYPGYIDDYWAVSVIREYDVAYEYRTSNPFETEWTQEFGYNQSFEYKSDKPDEHIPVGCGPVAVGQVMYYYKYPSFFNWSNMTKTGYGNEITSDFLLDVKNKCNAKYTEGEGTGCTTDDMIKALKTYGYSCKKNKSVDWHNLCGKGPTIATSRNVKIVNGKEKTVGHAWVVEYEEGIISYTTVELWTFVFGDEFKCIYQENVDDSCIKWFYVNWGWWGDCNGNYYFPNFLPNDGRYLSSKLEDAIVDIKPNM